MSWIQVQLDQKTLFDNNVLIHRLNRRDLVRESEISYRGDSILAEEQARVAADYNLQSNIEAEASARASAVSAEASARSAADTTLQNNINTEVSAREAAVTAELNARSSLCNLT